MGCVCPYTPYHNRTKGQDNDSMEQSDEDHRTDEKNSVYDSLLLSVADGSKPESEFHR